LEANGRRINVGEVCVMNNLCKKLAIIMTGKEERTDEMR
jgi:hypothetical protein